MKEMIEKEGIKSFYKGLKMALIATVASYGIYFFCYRFWKNYLTSKFNITNLETKHIALCTFLSGTTSTCLANPLWFINTRLTLAKADNKKGIFETASSILKTEGIWAFFKGVFPNMILVTNPIINFIVYEKLKQWLLVNKFSVNSAQIFIISGIAKTLATFATYPMLTVKVKMHAD
jgi:adenine nucleotide transporter 17